MPTPTTTTHSQRTRRTDRSRRFVRSQNALAWRDDRLGRRDEFVLVLQERVRVHIRHGSYPVTRLSTDARRQSAKSK